jgi:hypothetical protein
MPHDPLEVIAESYRGIHESTHVIAQATTRLVETHRLALRLQGFALVLLGATLLFTGYVVWQHLAMRQESTALQQAVLANTQTIAAQTRALLERLDARR